MKYKVVEKFISINGEGRLSGQLTVFIRFAGCNLDCTYCDTKWANQKDVEYELMTAEEIYEYVKASEVRNVTLTGGEPLLQERILDLLRLLSADNELSIEIETNGSILVKEITTIDKNSPKITMDYKLESSNMEGKMITDNFKYLREMDTVKFVVGDIEDLRKAKQIIEEYKLIDKTSVYLSPVFEKIAMEDIVEFMKDNKMNKVTLQAQLHKIIWDPETRGV